MTFAKVYLACALGLVSFTTQGLAADFQCVDTGPSAPGAPHMPTVTKDSDSYQATVEVNILDKGYSFVIEEYLDYEGNRGLTHSYRNGQKATSIYSYDTDEIFRIVDDKCVVSNISDSRFGSIFGSGSKTTGDHRHVFGSAAVLRFAADKHDVYNGIGEVRGIPADVYSTCLSTVSWPGLVGTARVTYYFSQTNWSTSAPRQQLPLRIEVEGLTSTPSRGRGPPQPTAQTPIPRHFHHIYDFINYLPYIAVDSSMFLTPPNVVCENREVTNAFPKLGRFFSFRSEQVDPLSGIVEHRAVWYDLDAKLTRHDFRWQPPGSAQYTNGITSITDFNTGVEYAIDHVSGCRTSQAKASDLGAHRQDQNLDGVQFFTVDVQDPNSLFYLDINYTYVGQRKSRGILCDVFISNVNNYTIDGTPANTTFEYHFLASNWHDIPLDTFVSEVDRFPVQLVVNAPERYWTKVYNFYDFSKSRPSASVFDVSSCFDNSHRLGVLLTFPGNLDSSSFERMALTQRAHLMLAETMKINPIRVADVRISKDLQNGFVNAWILGTVNIDQFEKLPAPTVERFGDALYAGIQQPEACADLCVNHEDFQCNGYQFCPGDDFSCRLSKTRVVTGEKVTSGAPCDAFARTAAGPTFAQPSLKDAYNSLVTAVKDGEVQISLEDPNGFEPPPFTAIAVEITSGALVKDKPMPSLPSKFFYRVETVIPDMQAVVETDVWYDSELKLVRYDSRDPSSQLEVTVIHDFNTGVAYQINKVTEECTISTIGNNGTFNLVTPPSGNGSTPTTLVMKSPLDIFYIDASYKYVGQSTERGILCDVFESRRTDFRDTLSKSNRSEEISIFKYYFQAEDWSYTTAEGMDTTRGQMVRLELEDRTTNIYRTYNIFDFNDEHHAFSFYDTSACFEPEQRKSFLISFGSQPYHPTLDQASNSFLNSAIVKMAQLTLTSPVRFQKVSVTYDDTSVYLLVTALGLPPPIALFYKSGSVPHNTTYPQELALFPDDCAAACVQSTSLLCNSFDFCDADSESPSCLLRTDRTMAKQSSGPISTNSICTRYIRSENVTRPVVSADKIFQVLTDAVYDEKFQISITPPNQKSESYDATGITEDILRPTDPASASGSFLRNFQVTPGVKMVDSIVNMDHAAVSVIDCALLCLQENTFKCQAFDYFFSVGKCRLSSVHPVLSFTSDGGNSTMVHSDDTSVYTPHSNPITPVSSTMRWSPSSPVLYTKEYTKYDAVVFAANPDKIIENAVSAEACAMECTETTDFRCEAFEVCFSAKTCNLHKTHVFSGTSSTVAPSTQKPECVHYSRDHLYDYIRRDHKRITDHDEAVADVTDVSRCAYLCASGEVLRACASFEVTQLQHGNIRCVFSTEDPTNSSSSSKVSIEDSLEWALYTRANAIPIVNPTAHTGTHNASTKNPDKKPCSEASSSSSSDTNIRIGIAFGTLILGAILGAVIAVFGSNLYRRKYRNTEDLHGLSTWKH